MAARFFVADHLKSGTISLEGPEFHHMIRVSRHQIGDKVRLFDGSGREADAEITFVSRHAVSLHVGKTEQMPDEPGPALTLAVPIPKGTRSGWLLEKAVELGVSRMIPISTARSIVDPRESRIENWRGSIVAACKQCGRSRLMELTKTCKVTDLAKSEFAEHPTVVAHPGGLPFNESLVHSILRESAASRRPQAKTRRDSLMVVIGPEGGLTVEEISQAATAGAKLVSLGPRLLRVETAALYMASVFQAALSNL